MNEEQKQRMTHELGQWNAAMKSSCSVSDLLAISTRMAALLQDLIDAPEPESVSDCHVYVHVSGLTGSGKSAVAGEIEIAMRAIGLDVEWVDSKSEKRLTHADYTSALELYRPKVRIFEKNIPRTAPPAPSVPDGWQPIETAPKDNKRSLFLARFNDDGTMQAFDYDGTWQSERESWELPQVYYYWATALGKVEEPTHWMYEPEWFSKLNSAQQPAPPAARPSGAQQS